MGRLVLRSTLLLMLLVVLTALWIGWQVVHVRSDLNAAVDSASRLQRALRADDETEAAQALTDLQERAADAADRTDGPTWGLLTHLPTYGDDARGIQLVSNVLDDLSQVGLPGLTHTAGGLDGLLPRGARVDVEALRRLQEPVATGRGAFDKAKTRLGTLDSSGFISSLRDSYRDLYDKVATASRQLSSAETALQVMPAFLGDDGARNYLLVFQNNAEIRATGGLPGAVSLITADRGRVHLSRQVAASSFGEAPKPVLPLTPDEANIYGPQLGTYFLDANFTPDWPRASALMKARWEQVYDERIDGVLSIDPVALSYVLGALGPVQVGGITLTSDNAVEELLHGVYLRYTNPVRQDAFFRRVARTVFAKVTAGEGSPQPLIAALVRGTSEHRVYAHSFDPGVQDRLSGTAVSGELVLDPGAAPQVGFYLNDGTGAKMSYYLRFDVQVSSESCRNDVQNLSAHAVLKSQAPPDAASLPDYVTGGGEYDVKPGSQIDGVTIIAPVDGRIKEVMLNGRRTFVFRDRNGSRPVVSLDIQLDPGQELDLTWVMTTGKGQTGDVAVSVTPGVDPVDKSSSVASAC